MIGSMGILMGIVFAIYKNVDADKKAKYKGMLTATALAVFLTGVTEPVEYMFMFVAMPLYVIYALVQGLAFGMADIVNLRMHSFGSIEFLTRTPLAINAGLGMDILNFVWVTALFGLVMYFISDFMIRKFNYATPGRNGNYEEGMASSDSAAGSGDGKVAAPSQAVNVINLLGGASNISDVDACMTRLRVTVKDPDKVGSEDLWKKEGAMGLVMKDSGVQAIYGPKADVLKSDIQDLLDSGEVIPQTVMTVFDDAPAESSAPQGKAVAVASVADGKAIELASVSDPVFSQKMMGDGFAVEPSNGEFYAPVAATVTSIFPTKHALGLLTEEGLEILIHIGLDTVSLEGKPFTVHVAEGQKVERGDRLATADLDAIREAGRETATIVVFTNQDFVQSVSVNKLGSVTKDDTVATVEL